MTIFFASAEADNLASSIEFWMKAAAASVRASSRKAVTICCLASSAESPEIFSLFNLRTVAFLDSSKRLSTAIICRSRRSLRRCRSLSFLFCSSSCLFTLDSLSLMRFSASPIFRSRDCMVFSCSDLSSMNFSLAWRIFSFLRASASFLASAISPPTCFFSL